MFVAQAIANFSAQVMKAEKKPEEERNQSDQEEEVAEGKRRRSPSQDKQLKQEAEKEEETVQYATFEKGNKVLVKETFQNGWWYGHVLKHPELVGFFPSNYVQAEGKKPPPPPSKPAEKEQQQQQGVFDPQQVEGDFVQKELEKMQSGPVKSEYYQGIKGYKMVKIDEKNQNILKGNYVQYDVNTGLAKVPVKDQAPAAKAMRQMGYYFDYHQWNQTMNKNPHHRARPDPKKKKQKKLKLKMMD